MPKVRPLTRQAQLDAELAKRSDECEALLLAHHITKKELALFVNLDPSAVSHQFRNKSITLRTFVAVQMLVEEKLQAVQ